MTDPRNRDFLSLAVTATSFALSPDGTAALILEMNAERPIAFEVSLQTTRQLISHLREIEVFLTQPIGRA